MATDHLQLLDNRVCTYMKKVSINYTSTFSFKLAIHVLHICVVCACSRVCHSFKVCIWFTVGSVRALLLIRMYTHIRTYMEGTVSCVARSVILTDCTASGPHAGPPLSYPSVPLPIFLPECVPPSYGAIMPSQSQWILCNRTMFHILIMWPSFTILYTYMIYCMACVDILYIAQVYTKYNSYIAKIRIIE